MRKGLLLIGLAMLLIGTFAESQYVYSSKVAYNGPTLTMDIYMISGIVFILLGLLFTLSSVKIPKVFVPD